MGAWKMRSASPEILGLYLNKIFFGQRAYGVAAAAETFFGKPARSSAAWQSRPPPRWCRIQLPSRYSPDRKFSAACHRDRRTYVLRRMNELCFIDEPDGGCCTAPSPCLGGPMRPHCSK